jgi:outer membrane protein, heavy metal efflux system
MLFRMPAKNICLVCCLYFLQPNLLSAQSGSLLRPDTLRLSIKQAEQLFLDSNLQLLARRYNIRSNEALVLQARKWDNPILSTGQNIYARGEGWFKHGTVYDSLGNPTPQGEVMMDVEQLIKTAGKRRKQVDIAKTNVNIAEWEFNATMRSLRLTLITDFYTIAQLQGNAALYTGNMERLTKLAGAMDAQLKSGNIAKKEYLRVQALLVSLQHNMADNSKSLEDAESELKTALRLKGNIFIQPLTTEEEKAEMPALSVVQLVDSAKQHNTDYQVQAYQLQLQRQTLRLQKALAVPDVTVGTVFDQHATYAPNYWGLNIGLPLPLWDRNQGNIKSARSLVQAEEANMQELDTKLENDVLSAYKKLLYTTQLSSANNVQFYNDYYGIFKNMVEAFDRRQISMLEFLDYYNDYQNTRQQQLQQIFNLHIAKADLNDVVGMDVVK